SDRITVSAQVRGIIENDLSMMKPKLTGTDDDGSPYVITAEKAVQDPKNLHRVHLTRLEADMTTTDSHWMNATSVRGYFDMDAGNLDLAGGISFYSDSGYELHTEKLNIEMRKGLFHGPGPVNGHGPFGAMRSDRFEFNRVKQALVMLGNVHTTIMPAA